MNNSQSAIFCAKAIIGWLGIALSLVSAYYWYKASVAKVTSEKNEHNPGIELSFQTLTITISIYV